MYDHFADTGRYISIPPKNIKTPDSFPTFSGGIKCSILKNMLKGKMNKLWFRVVFVKLADLLTL